MAIGRGSLTRLTLLALLWGSGFLWIAIALRGFSPCRLSSSAWPSAPSSWP